MVIVSQSLAQRMFPNGDAVNHHMMWTDPVMKFIDISTAPRRIVGVAADIEDEKIVPGPAITVYHPFGKEILWGGRLFVHARGNPYALVTPLTRIIRDMSVDQIVERAATLEDVRAEVLTPNRLNALVFGGFAAVALLIAVVGVAGVLAFSVSGRTREFGIRLAIGSQPRHLLTGVITEGVVIAVIGIATGAACGFGLAQLAGHYFPDMRLPDAVPVAGSAVVLLAAAGGGFGAAGGPRRPRRRHAGAAIGLNPFEELTSARAYHGPHLAGSRFDLLLVEPGYGAGFLPGGIEGCGRDFEGPAVLGNLGGPKSSGDRAVKKLHEDGARAGAPTPDVVHLGRILDGGVLTGKGSPDYELHRPASGTGSLVRDEHARLVAFNVQGLRHRSVGR